MPIYSPLIAKSITQNHVAVQTDLLHTLGESAALGAAGVVLWGETKFAKSEVCNICPFVYQSDICQFVCPDC